MEKTPIDDAHPAEREAVCQACHARVPEHLIVFIGGRQLCFGCASAWFDSDE